MLLGSCGDRYPVDIAEELFGTRRKNCDMSQDTKARVADVVEDTKTRFTEAVKAEAERHAETTRHELGEIVIETTEEYFPEAVQRRRRRDIASGVALGMVLGFLLRYVIGER